MFNKLGNTIINQQLQNVLMNITTGIEVERDRTNLNGHLSKAPYPKNIGNEAKNPWITTDFLEAMTEVVTPPTNNDISTLRYSSDLTTVLRKNLSPNEVLWPMSMPPILPTSDYESYLAKASPKKRKYIEGLYKRYGFAKQTPCGVHINISLNYQILEFIKTHSNEKYKTIGDVENYIYPIIAQGFIKYRWFLTYLFGASPVAQNNYFQNEAPKNPIRSIRQSHFGYPTSFDIDYSNVDSYVDKIINAVKDGKIMSIAEFYGAVRFKGSSDLNTLKEDGIKYLELRMLDLDPTTPIAVKTSTLTLIRLMMAYFIITNDKNNIHSAEQTQIYNQMNDNVASEEPNNHCQYENLAISFVNNLRWTATKLNLSPEYLEVLTSVENQITDPDLTISGTLVKHINKNSLLEYGLKTAKQYQKDVLNSPISSDCLKDKADDLKQSDLKHIFN